SCSRSNRSGSVYHSAGRGRPWASASRSKRSWTFIESSVFAARFYRIHPFRSTPAHPAARIEARRPASSILELVGEILIDRRRHFQKKSGPGENNRGGSRIGEYWMEETAVDAGRERPGDGRRSARRRPRPSRVRSAYDRRDAGASANGGAGARTG